MTHKKTHWKFSVISAFSAKLREFLSSKTLKALGPRNKKNGSWVWHIATQQEPNHTSTCTITHGLIDLYTTHNKLPISIYILSNATYKKWLCIKSARLFCSPSRAMESSHQSGFNIIITGWKTIHYIIYTSRPTGFSCSRSYTSSVMYVATIIIYPTTDRGFIVSRTFQSSLFDFTTSTTPRNIIPAQT